MESLESFAGGLIEWYENHGRPVFERYTPDRLELLDAELVRLKRLREAADREVQVCFLGNSGVGKSTLINALVAKDKVILPQGGVGPLTAQAVTVRASAERYFRASYLPPKSLNRTLFTLERSHERALSKEGTQPDPTPQVPTDDSLAPDDLDLGEIDAQQPGAASQELEDLKRRARLMLLGSQWGEIDLPLLLDGLRLCLEANPRWGAEISGEMSERIQRIKSCLALGKEGSEGYVCREADAPSRFKADLDDHASGFLAPLIRTLEVGWDADLLNEGAVLTDLPGLGTSGDDYQNVTKQTMREARMVVLVVDRSGVSESSAHLLHSTGFLNALLHDGHDPTAEATTLVIVMVKIDDTATDAWQADRERNGPNARKWTEHLALRCAEADRLIRDQARKELGKLVDSGPAATRDDRELAVAAIMAGLRVHAVSAPQYARFLRQDPEDHARITEAEQSRIPALSGDLRDLVKRHQARTYEHLRNAAVDFRGRLASLLELTRARWEDDSQTDEELKQLRTDLETFLTPLRRELDPRRGAFKAFLTSEVPNEIALRVDNVASEARQDIAKYLRRYEDYHWATLRAAVTRGGSFDGSRHIDLPSELTLRFEDPIAVVWTKHILQKLRAKTRELSDDYIGMLDAVIEWAIGQGAKFQPKLLEGAREQLRGDAKILATVGRDAINELKESVKKELYSRIETRVRNRCKKFVEDKQHLGSGTKYRILTLLREELADSVVEGAKPAALKVLTDNFDAVAAEIREAFQRYGNPLDHASSELLDKHEERVRRADKQRRKEALTALADAGLSMPPELEEAPATEVAA